VEKQRKKEGIRGGIMIHIVIQWFSTPVCGTLSASPLFNTPDSDPQLVRIVSMN